MAGGGGPSWYPMGLLGAALEEVVVFERAGLFPRVLKLVVVVLSRKQQKV